MVEESYSKLCSLVEHNSVHMSNLTEQMSNLNGIIQGTYSSTRTREATRERDNSPRSNAVTSQSQNTVTSDGPRPAHLNSSFEFRHKKAS